MSERGSKTPAILRYGLDRIRKKRTSAVHVSGIEHVSPSSRDEPRIFAISHLTDSDIPLAAGVLAPFFDIGISNVESHHNIWAGGKTFLSMLLAGKHNFFPIHTSMRMDRRLGNMPLVQVRDYLVMRDAMRDKRKTIVIAAHKPTHGILPAQGGVGAMILSQLSEESVVVPVSVSMQSAYDPSSGRLPEAHITISPPIRSERLSFFPDWMNLMQGKNKKGHIREILSGYQILRGEARPVMEAIARGLPQSLRGSWLSE